jgi:hypothetical protein
MDQSRVFHPFLILRKVCGSLGKLLKSPQVAPQILPNRTQWRDRQGQCLTYVFTIRERVMRLSAWSTGVGVLMIAFPISLRCARADAPNAKPIASGTRSATVSDLSLERIAPPSGSIHSSSGQPLWTVALPQFTKVGLSRGSFIHPNPPKIHTRPKKKKTSWWPFGRK